MYNNNFQHYLVAFKSRSKPKSMKYLLLLLLAILLVQLLVKHFLT